MFKQRKHPIIGNAIMILAIVFAVSSLSFAAEKKDWHFNGTVIEACSCPMFCPCYFNTEPALHRTETGAERFCKFNMAYKINEGYYGDTNLAGVKFWVAGDLGHSWKKGNTEWAVVTFQNGTTEAQKAGVATALSHIFPVKWNVFRVAVDAEITWTATADRAEAKLDGGTKAHTILNRWKGMDGRTGMLTNISYFAAPRNSGFKMMPNEVETWKVGEKAFRFEGSTGFMITVDMKSADLGT